MEAKKERVVSWKLALHRWRTSAVGGEWSWWWSARRRRSWRASQTHSPRPASGPERSACKGIFTLPRELHTHLLKIPLCSSAPSEQHVRGTQCIAVPVSNLRSVFGPSAAAARLEGSKSFLKQLCSKYGIPTAASESFRDAVAAKEYIRWGIHTVM